MNLQRFLFTSLPGTGFVELASDNGIPTRLKEAIRQPQAATISRGFDAGLGVAVWEGISSVVCTYLERMQDEHRRYYVASHSVIVPLDDYTRMAPHFDDAILTPLREGITAPLEGFRNLEPLIVPKLSAREAGIRPPDLEILGQYIPDSQKLESLLACLFDQKDFTLTIQTDQEWEAIKVTVGLLKLAATAGVYPQPDTGIATFTPSRGIPNLYGSKVLPDRRLRVISELALQGGHHSKKAQSIAERLVPEIQAGNIKGIEQAIRAGDARARTPSASPSVAPPPAPVQDRPSRPAAEVMERTNRSGPADREASRLDPKLQEWESDLTSWQQELAGREGRLEEWQENLSKERHSLDIERRVLAEQREELRIASEEIALSKTEPKLDEFWQLYDSIDELIRRDDLGNLKEDSIKALGNLIDDLRRKLRGRSASARGKVLKLLDEEEIRRNLSRLADSANLWKKFDELNDEFERQRRPR